jgi:hypothetical protein
MAIMPPLRKALLIAVKKSKKEKKKLSIND